MLRSIPTLIRFALDAERTGDVVFKLSVLVILAPVLLVLVVADLIVEVWL